MQADRGSKASSEQQPATKKHKHRDKSSSKSHDKAKKSGATSSAAAAPGVKVDAQGYITNSKTRPNLSALSAGLPEGWRAMWDQQSGDVYYGCPDTKVRWQAVTPPHPAGPSFPSRPRVTGLILQALTTGFRSLLD